MTKKTRNDKVTIMRIIFIVKLSKMVAQSENLLSCLKLSTSCDRGQKERKRKNYSQRKKKQKIKINFSRAKAHERKEFQKGSGGESEHKYDMVSLHAEDDSELADNLNNVLGTRNESEMKIPTLA